MCNNAEFNSGRVLMPAEIRAQITKELDMSANGITNNLKALKDLNLISGEKGVFTINP
jgi:predicted transcriptional regulator